MWKTSLTISGYGYIHNILELGTLSVVQIKAIQLMGVPSSEDGTLLECVVNGDLRTFLEQQQKLVQEGHGVIIKFLAKLLKKREFGSENKKLSFDAKLLLVSQVYVNGVKQHNAFSYDHALNHQ